MKPEIKIGLVDSHLAVSEALRMLLNNEQRFIVSDIAQDYESGKQLIHSKNSDIVVLGMNLGKYETLELITIANTFQISTIIFSAFTHIQLIRKAMKAGASAFISKSSPSDHIIQAITHVTMGGVYYDPIIQEKINSLLDPNPRPNSDFKTIVSHLTNREKEVLRLVAQEYTSKEIAKELHLSKNTVDGYRKNLIRKLGVRGSVGLARLI